MNTPDDAYDAGPLAEGWRFQRDTAAYAKPYGDPTTEYPNWAARPLSLKVLQEELQAAMRNRDM